MNINKNIRMEHERLRVIKAELEQTDEQEQPIATDEQGNPIFPIMDEV